MEGFLIIGLVILLIALMGAIIYEGRQIKRYNDLMAIFIDGNSELFGVVNANAETLRQGIERIEGMERTVEFFKMILDAHAHALKIYGPALTFENSPSDQIQRGENFLEEKI